MAIDVSIITINFNSHEETIELVKSILSLNEPEYTFEIVVVDNASDYNPEKDITPLSSKIKYIRSEENLGFAGGNNLGIQNAEGAFLFFLNNDTVIYKNTIPHLLGRFKEDQHLGMVSPKILFYQTNIIQYAGFSPLNTFSRNFAYGNREEDNPEFNKYTDTYSAHGAAMMISSEAVKNVGPMPDDYFLYYEELDWSQRFKSAGYKVKVDQNVIIYHKESASIGKHSKLKSYYLTRNRILFVRRNFKGMRKAAALAYLYLVVIPKNISVAVFNANFQLAKIYWKAMIWNILN